MNFVLIVLLFLLTFNTAFADPDGDLIDQSPQHDEPAAEDHKAVDWELLYIGDGLYGVYGPYKDNSTLLDNLLLNVTLDSEKIFKIKGNTIFFTYIRCEPWRAEGAGE